MRLSRSTTLFVSLLLLSLAASALQGAVIVTLSIQPNSLSDGQTASLKALVTGTTNAGVIDDKEGQSARVKFQGRQCQVDFL